MRKRKWFHRLAALGMAGVLAASLAGCSGGAMSEAASAESSSASAAATSGGDEGGASQESQTSGDEGDTIKVGILHSLSGTMAISETSVRDAEILAIEEINAAGGVLGKQIEYIVEDGASDNATFTEKATKLLENDKVATVFGCWTSASRKAVVPYLKATTDCCGIRYSTKGWSPVPM